MEAYHNKMEYGSEGEEILQSLNCVSRFWRLLEASSVGHVTEGHYAVESIKHVFLQGVL